MIDKTIYLLTSDIKSEDIISRFLRRRKQGMRLDELKDIHLRELKMPLMTFTERQYFLMNSKQQERVTGYRFRDGKIYPSL